ncbi:ChaN family lipoprotein [Cohaesibacter haloalkalitolerans]|uniref:ChaN family lipoprotein n=1 Tax=Cohaesibacter haloalkalitolerans TaxID=1162980 RepID=UPI000E6495F2|nr:ChaN family lipoprotein [Cohaesibacter haloalkalitolerans]
MSGFHPSAPYTDINDLPDGEIVHLATGIALEFDKLVDAVEHNQVLYLGENHDNHAAHEVQLRLIRALFEKRKGRIAIGMEMFRSDVQEPLNGLTDGSLSCEQFNQLFDAQWSWRPAYQAILDFIHQNRLPLIGLKPTKVVEDVVREGGRDGNTPELDLADAHHRPHYLPRFENNSHPERAERSYRIMTLWDETMADNVARFISDPANRDTMMITIAGSGHINYGFGIPKRTFRRFQHSYTTLLPLAGHDTEHAANLPIADYVWKVPYVVKE